MLGGSDFTLFGAFTRPFPGFWTRRPGLFSFALGQLFDLQEGEQFTFRQTIHVGTGADAATITDRFYRGPTLAGQVDTSEASIGVFDDDGYPLTFARPDSDGRFSLRLPEGHDDVELEVRTPWNTRRQRAGATGPGAPLAIDTGAPGILLLPQGPPRTLLFTATDNAPIFHDELAPLTIGGKRVLGGAESYRLNLSGTDADPAEVRLPPGSYKVIASRGPEYSATIADIELEAGGRTELVIAEPQRAVPTPGLIGVDFHVHSGVSFDSSLLPRQRVVDFIAQGGEVIVPTEHNVSYDLRPVIDALGLSGQLHSFPGVELTGMARSTAAPTTIGHSNVFPITVAADAFMGGTLPFEGRRLGQVIDGYKTRFPASVFQLNHPRTAAFDDDITFFNHLSQGNAFDAALPLDQGHNRSLVEPLPDSTRRDIDFDAIELLNGESMDIYEKVREDWFALLQQGMYKVATANSDSHVSSQLVAYPRSYVAVEDDNPGRVTTEAITRSLLDGRVYGSTGPILRVDLDGAGPGATVTGAAGVLSVAVQSAPWVDVEEVRIWLNGELWRQLPLRGGAIVETDIDVQRDSFVFVEALGEASPIYAQLLPGFRPFAFANPIFIDVAGDGWRYNEE